MNEKVLAALQAAKDEIQIMESAMGELWNQFSICLGRQTRMGEVLKQINAARADMLDESSNEAK